LVLVALAGATLELAPAFASVVRKPVVAALQKALALGAAAAVGAGQLEPLELSFFPEWACPSDFALLVVARKIALSQASVAAWLVLPAPALQERPDLLQMV
jgi:hypothetical protein